MIPCPGCQRDTNDGLLCDNRKSRSCTGDLRRDLNRIPDLMRMLLDTRTGQAVGGGHGARIDPSPLPIHPLAMDAAYVATNTIGTWIRELDMGDIHSRREIRWWNVSLTKGEPCRWLTRIEIIPLPATMTAWCGWLDRRIARIRGHADAAAIAGEIESVAKLLVRTIQPHVGKRFAGPCDVCGGDIFGWPGDDTGTCKACGVVVNDIARRWARMDAAVEDQICDKQTILRAMPALAGQQLTDTRFRKWVSRRRIHQRIQTVHRNRWVVGWRVGDVIDLMERASGHRTSDTPVA